MHRRLPVRHAPPLSWLAASLLLALAGPLAAEAPDLTLKDVSGVPRDVGAYIGRGDWTVVAVWSADCPICRREMYHMTFLQEEHEGKGVRVLGVSVDGYEQIEKVRDFIDEQSLNFPTLIGAPADAQRLSGQPFQGTPTYYFFAPDGRFLRSHLGAMTQRQAEQVLAALKRQAPRRR